MKTVTLVCNNCGKEHEKPRGEYNRRIRLGKSKFYCCQSCATIDINTVHSNIIRKCLWCEKEFESTTHKKHKRCCSTLCSHRVSQSFVDTSKISSTLRNRYDSGELLWRGKGKVEREKVCPFCEVKFVGNTKYCSKKCVTNSRRSHLPAYEKYKRECQFNFGIRNYPAEFDFGLIEKHGWYKPKNHGDNLGGVSRDHIMSIKWGFENGIDAEYIRHPANCKLMLHTGNISKGKKQSILLKELIHRIKIWDKKYFKGV